LLSELKGGFQKRKERYHSIIIILKKNTHLEATDKIISQKYKKKKVNGKDIGCCKI